MADLVRASAAPDVGKPPRPERGAAQFPRRAQAVRTCRHGANRSDLPLPGEGAEPERLSQVTLTPRASLPCDRAYAIENGPSDFDPQKPQYFPKIRFLELMRNARLAALRTSFDEDIMC